jgi:protein-disulfide isomerase
VVGAILQDLTPPVDLDRDHCRGGERAVVTLVEYGDYECPYSRMAFRTIQRLEQQFAGQLRFVFRQLPLTGIHPHALAAAHFAEAAALQGRFWPMHELWTGNGRWPDLDSQTVRQRVQADVDSALESGARGTPTLFLNGRLHQAGYDEAVLGAALAAAIKET